MWRGREKLLGSGYRNDDDGGDDDDGDDGKKSLTMDEVVARH